MTGYCPLSRKIWNVFWGTLKIPRPLPVELCSLFAYLYLRWFPPFTYFHVSLLDFSLLMCVSVFMCSPLFSICLQCVVLCVFCNHSIGFFFYFFVFIFGRLWVLGCVYTEYTLWLATHNNLYNAVLRSVTRGTVLHFFVPHFSLFLPTNPFFLLTFSISINLCTRFFEFFILFIFSSISFIFHVLRFCVCVFCWIYVRCTRISKVCLSLYEKLGRLHLIYASSCYWSWKFGAIWVSISRL